MKSQDDCRDVAVHRLNRAGRSQGQTLAWVVLLLALILGACTPASTPAPAAGQTLPEATRPPAFTPLPPSATPLPTFTPTLPPTPTPLPPQEVAFYRLRIEYSTGSDWTTLELSEPGRLLTVRLLSTSGDPINPEASAGRLSMGQPLNAAEAGKSVGLTADLALAAGALDQPLGFLLQKGAIRGSTVRVLLVLESGETQLLREIRHSTVVEADPGLNPLRFTVDLSPLQGIAPRRAQLTHPGQRKMIWAFYYPWYTLQSWNSEILKDRPLEPYSSLTPRAITRHVEQAHSAGIDGFISSWWGPGTDTDQALGMLLDIAQDRGFAVSIYFETLKEDGPQEPGVIREWLAYAIRTYRDHPAFMKVDGRPVIMVWASETVPLATWGEIFAGLRAQGLDAAYLAMSYNPAALEVFDGLHQYGVFNTPDLAEVEAATGRAARYYPLLADAPTPRIWAATVQPGYDDTLIPGREGQLQARENGDFYRSTFEAALASDPDWIFITSWNEWWEHTHIEPSELYGELFLQITREYAELWKGE